MCLVWKIMFSSCNISSVSNMILHVFSTKNTHFCNNDHFQIKETENKKGPQFRGAARGVAGWRSLRRASFERRSLAHGQFGSLVDRAVPRWVWRRGRGRCHIFIMAQSKFRAKMPRRGCAKSSPPQTWSTLSARRAQPVQWKFG